MSKPLACPFCGSDKVIMQHRMVPDCTGASVRIADRWVRKCYGCGASGPIGDTPQMAESRWNTRPGVALDPEHQTHVRTPDWLWDVRSGLGLSRPTDSDLGE